METLFIYKPLTQEIWYLEDSKKNLVGRFNSEEEAKNWCKENGYKARIKL